MAPSLEPEGVEWQEAKQNFPSPAASEEAFEDMVPRPVPCLPLFGHLLRYHLQGAWERHTCRQPVGFIEHLLFSGPLSKRPRGGHKAVAVCDLLGS